MKKLASLLIIAVASLSGPAMADDFLANCKAMPRPKDAPAESKETAEAWCTCADKESAANPAARASLAATFKMTDYKAIQAAVTPEAKAIADKCRGGH